MLLSLKASCITKKLKPRAARFHSLSWCLKWFNIHDCIESVFKKKSISGGQSCDLNFLRGKLKPNVEVEKTFASKCLTKLQTGFVNNQFLLEQGLTRISLSSYLFYLDVSSLSVCVLLLFLRYSQTSGSLFFVFVFVVILCGLLLRLQYRFILYCFPKKSHSIFRDFFCSKIIECCGKWKKNHRLSYGQNMPIYGPFIEHCCMSAIT